MGLQEMFKDFEFGLKKWALIVVAIVLFIFLVGYAVGHCAPPPKVTDCQAGMSTEAGVASLQSYLDWAKEPVKVVDAMVIRTKDGKNGTVLCRAIDKAGNNYMYVFDIKGDDIRFVRRALTKMAGNQSGDL